MATSKITVKQFVNLLEDAGYNVRSYSGRGMYGAYCVGVTIERGEGSVASLVADVMVAVMENSADLDTAIDNGYELAKVFKNAATDSMGLDSIVYFPYMKVEAGELDDTSDDYNDEDDDN